ncbi:EAL domain-containing protein [Virgibacillus byunsanensis]|uniref:EAL domain-containing protein n=1 Tax=Virgibacillus byunsanensis TaxID=570945 RepID=A0ABW3LQP1_9BACI
MANQSLTLEKINNIIIHHHYQPIYNLINWRICGFEVLFRSASYENPLNAFEDANKIKKLFELDMYSLKKAVTNYFQIRSFQNGVKLYANIFPSTLVNPKFITFIEDVHFKKLFNSIVLEISETEMVEDIETLKNVTSLLKEKGVQFAIDDFGKGPDDFKKLIELKPNIVKLDRYFSKEIDRCEEKKELVKNIVKYCKKFNIKLILEGIETPTELATAKLLGIKFAQGYMLGEPEKSPVGWGR